MFHSHDIYAKSRPQNDACDRCDAWFLVMPAPSKQEYSARWLLDPMGPRENYKRVEADGGTVDDCCGDCFDIHIENAFHPDFDPNNPLRDLNNNNNA